MATKVSQTAPREPINKQKRLPHHQNSDFCAKFIFVILSYSKSLFWEPRAPRFRPNKEITALGICNESNERHPYAKQWEIVGFIRKVGGNAPPINFYCLRTSFHHQSQRFPATLFPPRRIYAPPTQVQLRVLPMVT